MSPLQTAWVVRMEKVTTQSNPWIPKPAKLHFPSRFCMPTSDVLYSAWPHCPAGWRGAALPGAAAGREPGGLCCTWSQALGFDAVPARFSIVGGSLDSSFLWLLDLGTLVVESSFFTPSCWECVGHALNMIPDFVCEQGRAAILGLQFV